MSRESPEQPAAGDTPLAASLDSVRHALSEERTLELSQVADAAGLDTNDLETLFRAASRVQDDGLYGDSDVAYAISLAAMLAYDTVDRLSRLLRLRLRAMYQVAINDTVAITTNPAVQSVIAGGMDAEGLGELIAAVSAELVPAVQSQLGMDYRTVLHRLLQTEIVDTFSRDVTRPVTMAVGFVDLVGFTKLSAATDLDGVDDVLGAFDDVAVEAVEQVEEILIAKMIGDAVMLVGHDVNELADVILHILEADPPALAGIQRRGGMGHGEVVVREGDYVGTTVNRAARLTDLARPGSLVIAEDSVALLDEQRWYLRQLKPSMLKGLGHSRPYRVRRREPDDAPG